MTLNPYELNGRDFLFFYALAFAFISLIIWPRRPPASGKPPISPERLRLEHWAVLSGGRTRAAQATFARALHDGIIVWNESELRYEPKDPDSNDALARMFAERSSPAQVIKSLETSCSVYEKELEKWGLLQTREESSYQPIKISLGYGFFLLMGLVRVFQGLTTHHPVGFLVLAMILAGLFWFGAIKKCRRQTREGLEMLNAYTVKNDHIRRAPPHSELPLAVALGGIAALNGSAYGHAIWALDPEKKRLESSDSGGWTATDTGSSGDSGDGGGSGCGGCGGD